MLTKKIKFTDIEGNEVEQEFRFHMSQAELTKLQLEVEGGYINKMKDILNKRNVPELSKVIDQFIMASYGEKSPNGISFIKNDEIRELFKCSDAYSVLYMELMGSQEAFAEFIKGIIPKDVAEKIAKAEKDGTIAAIEVAQ